MLKVMISSITIHHWVSLAMHLGHNNIINSAESIILSDIYTSSIIAQLSDNCANISLDDSPWPVVHSRSR